MSSISFMLGSVLILILIIYIIVRLRKETKGLAELREITAQTAAELVTLQREYRVARKKKAGMEKIREQAERGLTETSGDVTGMTDEEIEEVIEYFAALGYETELEYSNVDRIGVEQTLIVIRWGLAE